MNRCLWSHENCVGTVVLFAVGWRGIQRERALSASESRLGQIWGRILRASEGDGITRGRIRSPVGEMRRLETVHRTVSKSRLLNLSF